MIKLTTRDSFAKFADVLQAREAFKTSGSLNGGPVTVLYTTGRLSEDLVQSARSADYVVWSYATPIAWHLAADGWVVPEVSYSVTTSRQQGKIRAAVSVMQPVPVEDVQASLFE